MSQDSSSSSVEANVHSRREHIWVTEKSVHPSKVDKELEEFGSLTKCETKCEKTYYKCTMRRRFGCDMVIRTVREVVTGFITIETCGASHSHDESKEQFVRGLSNSVKESIDEITKFNHRIRPKALQRALITAPFNYSTSAVDISKVSSYLKRVRRTIRSSYVEHTVAGLWNSVRSRQFDETSSDWASYFYTSTADMAVSEAGSSDARVELFATTRCLLENIRQVSDTAGVMQVVLDSKHRVLMNNYPITALGILDAGQQFNLIALAVSNKEDEELYTSFLKSIQSQVQGLGITWDVTCTMSDNSDAIQNAFETCFPTSRRGNCNFHIHQNIKKKRSLWDVTVPSTLLASQKPAYVQRVRGDRERFAQDSIRWLSSLQNEDDFTCASRLFLEILRAQGDQGFYDALSKEYFEESKRGWARAFITPGSATTNNALESFNGNVLAKDVAAGSRMTIAQLFEQLDGVFRVESATGHPPITPIDVRECVWARPHMKSRVKEWYAKAVELGRVLSESSIPAYETGHSGDFYMLSSASMKQGFSIDSILARRPEVIRRCNVATAAARTVLQECVQRGNHDGGPSLDHMSGVMKNLREALDVRDTSFYHIRHVPSVQNRMLHLAQATAERVAEDTTADEHERTKAVRALNSGRLLYFGALDHSCSCPGFWVYGVCKHSLWATMETTGEGPPPHVDPRALATRRRGGRPRSAGRALHRLTPTQNPLH
jgi:MULE transposase domain